MADQGKTFTEKQLYDADFPDVSLWGGKDVSGAYAPGTTVMIGGEEVDLSTVPDVVGGKGKPTK